MTKEEKTWLEKVANVIDNLASNYHYTNASVEASPGDVFFDDACRYVDLVFELNKFASTLRGIVKYGELSEHSSEHV